MNWLNKRKDKDKKKDDSSRIWNNLLVGGGDNYQGIDSFSSDYGSDVGSSDCSSGGDSFGGFDGGDCGGAGSSSDF